MKIHSLCILKHFIKKYYKYFRKKLILTLAIYSNSKKFKLPQH